MRRLLVFAVVSVVLVACTEAGAPASSRPGSSVQSGTYSRVDVYEAMIRYLAKPDGPKPIYVLSALCSQLMDSEGGCPDRLSRYEQRALGGRLQDLGAIVFRTQDDSLLPRHGAATRRSSLGRSLTSPTASA